MYYLKTSRFSKPIQHGTDDCLAPNAYYIDKETEYRKNLAPFNQSADRSSKRCENPIYTEAIYNASISKRIKGASALLSRSERFPEVTQEPKESAGSQTGAGLRYRSPGPTTYRPKEIKPKGYCCRPERPIGRGRLYVCRVPYTHSASAPSIPGRFDTEGYEVDENDNLHKRPPPDNDQTLGPAFYTVPAGEFCWTTLRYHGGCEWAKSKTQRTNPGARNVNPGPGHYDLAKGCLCRRAEADEYVRQMARLFSYTPRFLDKQECDTLLNNFPAPGQYDLPACKKDDPNALSLVPRPLICRAKRFKENCKRVGEDDKDSANPGPGEYCVCDCYKKQKQFSKIGAPFQVIGPKFARKHVEQTPGPQTYSVPGSMAETLKGSKYACQPFNQTSHRDMTYIKGWQAEVPGPKYNVRKRNSVKSCVYNSMFKSDTDRFPPKRVAAPDLGTYDVTGAYKRLRDRKTFSSGKVAFLSRQAKKTKLSLGPDPAQLALLPSPDVYDPKLPPSGRTTYFDVSPRFKDQVFKTPGPGAYKLHPSVQHSMYKSIATHSILLNKNAPSKLFPDNMGPDGKELKYKKHRVAPKGSWAKELRKPKVMRWFTISPDEFEHCFIGTLGHASKCHVSSA